MLLNSVLRWLVPDRVSVTAEQLGTVMIEEPLQLAATEIRGRLAGGNTRPLMAIAVDDTGGTHEIVLKLRHPDGPPGGHFGPTSLTCELVCAALARSAGMLVPDYAVVTVSADLALAAGSRELRDLLRQNVGHNFGCRYIEGLAPWDATNVHAGTALISAAEDALAFDATIINGDRKATKPNMLWRGSNVYLIDHSLAMPLHFWGDAVVEQSPLLPEDEVRQHCTFGVLQNKSRLYEEMLQRWTADVSEEDLDRLRSYVPPEWEHETGAQDRIFRFLKARQNKFDGISVDLRRILR